jgi:hypothetical protein
MLTPPEKQETLEEFYRLCQPPGFWGKVTSTLPPSQHLRIRRELRADVYECALGVAFCTASVALVANLFGRHWFSSGECAIVGVVAFTIFVRRWLKRGVFSSLATGP